MTLWGRLARVTLPVNPVDLETAKAHLRLDGNERDDLVQTYVRAAADFIEGPDGAGIAINSQSWDLYLDYFEHEMCIPLAPLITVDSITYTDEDGNTGQTVSSAVYEVDTHRGLVRALSGQSWPSTDTTYDAVRIRFTAGHATVPGDLSTAVLLISTHLFENAGDDMGDLPMAAQMIIERYRRGRFV